MTWPAGVVLRTCSLGPDFGIVSGEDYGCDVIVSVSRPTMTWGATGSGGIGDTKTLSFDPGQEVTFQLPVTDQEGWYIGGLPVDVSDGKQSHLYNLTIKPWIYGSLGRKTYSNATLTLSNLAVPTGDGMLDLDLSVATSGAQGGTVTIPSLVADLRGAVESSADAAAASATAAQSAAQQAHDISGIDTSDGVVTALIADDGSTTTAQLKAAVAGYISDPNPDPATNPVPGALNGAIEAPVASGLVDRRRDLPYTQSAQASKPRPVRVQYRPDAATNVVIDNAGANRDVDAANLSATIVCPASGKIRFRLEAGIIVNAGTALRWIIRRNGSSITSTETIVYNNLQAANTGVIRTSAEGVIDVDETGAALVPGKTYTFTWGHGGGASSKVAYTCMGGNIGAAVMTLEPVEPNYRDAGYSAASSGYDATWPLWLCHDRITLLGTSASPWRVKWSTDGGTSWSVNNGPSFGNNVQQLMETDDGEVLAFVNAMAGENPTIWKSAGWPADHAAATWTKVLTQQGPDATTSVGLGPSWREFGYDAYGTLAFAAEYGPKNDPSDMARYIYMSEDYGATWRTIFDLADYETTGAHCHGVSYDPWWDAIWVTTGDDVSTKGEISGNFVSFDRGATWTRLTGFAHQCTTVIAIAACVLFVTDNGGPNCIYRIPRTSRDTLAPEIAYTMSTDDAISAYGTQAFHLRSMPDAPVLFAMQTDVTAGPALLIASYDGYNFKEIWRDSATYANRGLLNVAGPLADGRIVAHMSRGDGTLDQRERMTFTPLTT